MKGINVKSEIKTLKKVLLHRPGKELLNLTPDTLGELLFDDIPFLKVAQEEHDAFAKILKDNGVEVVYLEDLMTEVLKLHPELVKPFLYQWLEEGNIHTQKWQDLLYNYLIKNYKGKELVLKTMGIIIGLVGMEDKSNFAKVIVNGFADMISVNLVIALSHATAWLLEETHLGGYLVQASVTGLANSGMPQWLFIFLDYILHIGLSFLVPSSSGLAGISAPIVSPIVSGLHGSVETSIMAYVAASGVVNLLTPTNGAIMMMVLSIFI